MVQQIVTGRASVIEGGDLTVRARLRDRDNNAVVDTDVSAITVYLFDQDSKNPSTPKYKATLTVGSVMQSALTTDSGWTLDGTGYTFKHTLAYTNSQLEGGKRYRLEYRVETSSTGWIQIQVDVEVRSAYNI